MLEEAVMKTLLKNCKIYDGTGADAYLGSILFEDEKIVGVGTCNETDADNVIDLEGKSVAPGFIDGHSHNDWFAIKNQPVKYFDPFIRQGITTFVSGNCGLSAVGFEKDTPHVDKMGGGLFFYNDTTGVYPTIGEYFKAVDRNMPCNMAVMVGHCSARASVAGNSTGKLTKEQEERMLSILEKGLVEGGAGVSLGLMYEPGIYADTDELKKVAELCCKHNKPLGVHPRAESKVSMAYPQLLGRSHLLRAEDELCEIAKGTNLKLQHSHAIFVGRKSFADKNEFVKMQNDLRKQGVDAMFDIYNEVLGVSVITVILPAWYQGMTKEEKNKPLTKLKLALLVKASSLLLGFGFDDIQIAYMGPGLEKYEGKTVKQIADENKKSPLKTYLQLCEESNFKGRVNMGPYSTPEIIREFERNPNCLYMTDAWVEDFGVQNPSIYDCFPKFLRDSLLGTGDTMPNTIRRMTGATADRYMLKDRGYLKKGCFADITVFDEDELKSATPNQEKSFGISQVFINGNLVLDKGTLNTEALKSSGHALKV